MPSVKSFTLPFATDPSGDQKCYYWVCASIMMDADDRADPHALERANRALSCAQKGECVRAEDCRELTLSAIARLLQQRGRP
ncbi:MAG: hypothetical protein NVV74_13320 [Magnetospirillum sp.]|nr:hypothetical protein [Magnetospirillum sp.]